MKPETTKTLIAEGKLILNGCDYVTNKGVTISRIYTGRRGTTEKWVRSDDSYMYRSLFEAYYKSRF